jgi:hypothetical protein
MNSSVPKTLPPEKNPNESVLVCCLCGKPVAIGAAKTNADGQAVHEECYLVEVQLERASRDDH